MLVQMVVRTRPEFRRRGSSLLRAVVVALSTLAILLVCFSLYQYGQTGSGLNAPPRERLPSTPTGFGESGASRPGQIEGMRVGEAVIGQAEGISFTLYREQGTRAAAEISVSKYLPKPGSENEFLLKDPIARFQTQAGNDVRVTAPEGMWEASRRGPAGWEPRRGRLFGGVVVEFDRRTETEKAALPPAIRDRLDPASILRVETEELEFDLEYNVLIVPKPLTLLAHDAMLEASDLELRFNEAEGRVDALRISRGGRVELLGAADQFGLAIPDAKSPDKITIVNWLRESIRSRLAEIQAREQPAPAAPQPGKDKPAVVIAEDGVPVFYAGGRRQADPADTALRYFARFEGNIDAAQEVDGAPLSRFMGDWLEVYRTLAREGEAGRQESAEAAPPTGATADALEAKSTERIVLEWDGPMRVEAVPDIGSGEAFADRILAGGTPAKLSSPEVEVTCGQFEYLPGTGEARFFAAERGLVDVRSLDKGGLRGRTVVVRTTGESFTFEVTGPGSVSGDFAGPPDVIASSQPAGTNGPGESQEAVVEFSGALRGAGRIIRRIEPDLTGHITFRRSQLLETAIFDGGARVRDGEAVLASDLLTLSFGLLRGWNEDKHYVRQVNAAGNVDWRRGKDRLACDSLEIPLTAAGDGRSIPARLTATGNVVAINDGRSLKAGNELLVDFERRTTAPASQGPTGAPSLTVAGEEAVASRVRASGGVMVEDAIERLAINGLTVDCALADGREVDRAIVTGTADQPASVIIEEMHLLGETIIASVKDQSADVPGAGRMIIESANDLNGEQLVGRTVPIEFTWKESMKVRGRENVAQFTGDVHVTRLEDDSTADRRVRTEFAGQQLRAELRDVQPESAKEPASKPYNQWGYFQPIVDLIVAGAPAEPARDQFNKEISSIYLVDDALVRTEEFDRDTGALRSRARLAGPRMSVNLREEVSRALVEGAGSLQLEGFEMNDSNRRGDRRSGRGDLFGGVDGAPSKTLIEWTGRMWYDFGIHQVRFEEDVDLKFLSGAQLERFFSGPTELAVSVPQGRATFIRSDLLTVILESGRSGSAKKVGMGGLSADGIRRFQASGKVLLKDEVEGVMNWITATDLSYDRGQSLIVVSGAPKEHARIVRQESGKLPMQLYAENAFFNPATGEVTLAKPTARGN